MDSNTPPDSAAPFTAEELKAASEISPEELMRQMAENAAEIEKLENEGKCSPSSEYDYDKVPREKKTQAKTKTKKSSGHKCDVCGKAFKRKYHLKSHSVTHTGERPFACSKCEKSFAHKCALKKHDLTHTGEKPFACSKCQKTFARKDHLKSHSVTHTGEKPFACSKCQMAFARKSHLKRHDLTHTNEKPHGCQHFGCKRVFSRADRRNTHMKTCPLRPDAPASANADGGPDAESGTDSDMEEGT